jgi:hypothetical protein
MYMKPDEAAYCITRIARSNALAAASTDSCARASHLGIAEGYEERLTSLTRRRRTDMALVDA